MASGNGTQQKPGTALALMAQRVAVEPAQLEQTLMQTAFKGASPAEFVVLVAVANKYDLDPFMREIYAFPKKGGGIVPLVPIDGWLKVIKRHPDFAGMDIFWSDELVKPAPHARECPKWVEVTIHHKSMPEHPTVHREWIDEMYRDTGPWNGTTKRMLEWKGIIQTGRVAFGLAGIYDQDEAERISDGEVIDGSATTVEVLGEEGWSSLLGSAADFGFGEDDVLANAASLLYEGPGPEMPREIAVQLYRAMQQAAEENAAAAQQAADGAQEAATGDDGASGEPEPAASQQARQDAQRERAAKSPSELAAEQLRRAQEREAAKVIARADVNRVYTQATIHEVEEPELLEWLSREVGCASIEEIPQRRLGDVIAFLESHKIERGAA